MYIRVLMTCKRQGFYNGANKTNIPIKYAIVKTIINSLQLLSLFVPCAPHRLNLYLNCGAPDYKLWQICALMFRGASGREIICTRRWIRNDDQP